MKPTWLAFAAVALLLASVGPAAADIVGPALVQADGTLKVTGRKIHLFGIYIAPSNRNCRTAIRPVRCGSRAVLALDFRIQSLVRCQPRARFRDGSLSAVCWVKGAGSILSPDIDLGAYLIQEGWAVALPGAPFEYVTLERIARARNKGVWGFQADSIRAR